VLELVGMISALILVYLLDFLIRPPVPGSLCTVHDPDFKEFRYYEKIAYCERNVSERRRIEICDRDGVRDRSEYTVDHIIPLSLGGSNKDDNLWCQHRSIAITREEYQAFLKLRRGEITREEAVKYILNLKFKPSIYFLIIRGVEFESTNRI
jgi:hypothetical protein